MKEVIVKDEEGFQLRIQKWECLRPEGLFAVSFIQATKDREGKIDNESVYEFFMTQEDINSVAKALTE